MMLLAILPFTDSFLRMAGTPEALIDVGRRYFMVQLLLWQLDFLARFFDSGSADFHHEIMQVYRFEALGAVPLGVNAAVMALLYGLGKTKLTLLLNFSRVFIFRIPVFWFLQNYTDLGSASTGAVMMISNLLTGIAAIIIGMIVIGRFRKEYVAGRCRKERGMKKAQWSGTI